MYTAPKAGFLVVQSEEMICESGSFTIGGFEEEEGALGAPISFDPEFSSLF